MGRGEAKHQGPVQVTIRYSGRLDAPHRKSETSEWAGLETKGTILCDRGFPLFFLRSSLWQLIDGSKRLDEPLERTLTMLERSIDP